MKKFIYKIIGAEHIGDYELNGMGLDGWELTAAHDHPRRPRHFLFYFKKEVIVEPINKKDDGA